MNVTLCDYELNELAYTDKIISSDWELKFNDIGTGEIHLNIDNQLLKPLIENKYMIIKQSDCEHDIIGVVVGVTYGDDIAIFCRTLNWFLSKMVTPEDFYADGEHSLHDTVAKEAKIILEKSYGCDIAFGNAERFTHTPYFWRNTYNLTSDCIKDCLDNDNAGHCVRIDESSGKFYLDILKGTERDYFISLNDGTAGKIEVQKDILDFANAGFYEKSVKTTDADGNETEETEWTEYAPPDDAADMYRWYALLSGTSVSEAKSSLKEKSEKKEILTELQRLSYETDYALGDFVKVQIENSTIVTTVTQQITSVNLSWSGMGLTETPVLSEIKEYDEGEPPEEENTNELQE